MAPETPFSDLPQGHEQKRGIGPITARRDARDPRGGRRRSSRSPRRTRSTIPYRLKAVFKHAHEIKARSPVRIAGVQVGRVVNVEPLPETRMARVDDGDRGEGPADQARRQLRACARGSSSRATTSSTSHPGTPAGEALASGSTIPPTQTTTPVQFGQFLTSLQKDTRENLQTLLREYSRALEGPGARGYQPGDRHWEEAYRNTAMSSRAYLGQEEGDLHRLLRGQGRAFGALSRNTEALKTLVTGLRRTAGGVRARGATT